MRASKNRMVEKRSFAHMKLLNCLTEVIRYTFCQLLALNQINKTFYCYRLLDYIIMYFGRA